MSVLKKLGRAIEKGVKRVATNPALNSALSVAVPSAAPFLRVAAAAAPPRPVAAPSYGVARDVQVGVPSARSFKGSNVSMPLATLPALGMVLPGVGNALGNALGPLVKRGARGIAKGAAGVAAGAAGSLLFDAAGNAVAVKRRRPRSKGITARELKSFTRVTKVLSKYCKTPPPMKRRTTRSKSCR